MATLTIYTEESLAQLLGCEPKLIADTRRRGEIEYFSIGKRNGIRYTQQQIEEWIKAKTKRDDSLTDIERKAIEYVRTNPLKI